MRLHISNILLAAIGFLSMTGNAAQTVPYSSDLGVNWSVDKDWTQAKRNSENYWVYGRDASYSTPGTGGGVMHTWEPSSASDAMLISPAIEVTEGMVYTVGLWVKTGCSGGEKEAFKVFMDNGNDYAALKATTPIIEKSDYVNNEDFERFTYVFTATATEDVYFGIMDCSEAYQGNIYATGFFIHQGENADTPDIPEVIKDLPYAADFSASGGFKEWTCLAGPEAETSESWSYNSYSRYPEFDRSEGKKEDNYFISPALNVVEPGQYLISMEYTAQGSFEVVLGTDNADPSSFTRVLASVIDANDFNVETEIPFTIENPGKYYIALHLCAESGTYMGYRLHVFRIKHNVSVPALISNLKAKPDKNDELKVELTWRNPDLCHDGTTLENLTKVELYRDAQLIATLTDDIAPGAACNYTDILSAMGSYTYTALAYNNNGVLDATPVAARSGFVGHPVAEFPFSVNTNSADDAELDMYSTEDANENGYNWEKVLQYGSTYFSSSNGSADDIQSADNYLVSPYLHLTPGYYLFTSDISSKNHNFEVGYSTSRHDISGTFVKLGGINDQQESSYNEYKVVLPIDEEGEYCLVWRHVGMSTKYPYQTVSLRSASLVVQSVLPAFATDFKATAPVGDFNVTLSWVNPVIDNANRVLEQISKAEIYRDGNLIATITDELVPGESSEYVDHVDSSAEYTYTVKIYNDNGCSVEEAPTSMLFVGEGMAIPYTADFNDWTIVNRGSYYAWGVDASGTAMFERGTWDDVVYDDGIYSPYLLFAPGYKYTVTFHAYGQSDNTEGSFRLQAGSSRMQMENIAEFEHTGAADEEFVVNFVTMPADASVAQSDDADDDSHVIAPGNISVGFHIFRNADVFIRDLKVEKSPLSSAVAIGGDNSCQSVCVVDGGLLAFGEGVTSLIVSDVTGRVVYFAESAPAMLNIADTCPKGVLLIKATAADGTPVTLKVRN